MNFARVELKYDKGTFLTVRTGWILNFNPKFKKTDDFLCYWSDNLDEIKPDLECGYSQLYTGIPSLFKVFIVSLGASVDEVKKNVEGKRVKVVAKRFRESGGTDIELKQIQAKKKRSANKELKIQKAKAQDANTAYFVNDLQYIEKKMSTQIKEILSEENDLTLNPSLQIATPVEESLGDNSDIPSNASLEPLQYNSYDQLVNAFLGGELNSTEEIAAQRKEILSENNYLTLHPSLQIATPAEETLKDDNDIPSHASLEPLQCNSHDQLLDAVLGGELNSTENQIMVDETIENFSEGPLTSNYIPEIEEPEENSESSTQLAMEPTSYAFISESSACNVDGNIIVLNFDELSQQNNELTTQLNGKEIIINELRVQLSEQKDKIAVLEAELDNSKLENVVIKQELENANKRNIMLQNYLVAANETIPEDLYVEKDGGRLYKGGVFLNEVQCLVLDNSRNDREFLNNLTTSIFGKEVLKTHSITGTPSNNTKGPAKLKLNPDHIQLIYEIMDARSFAKKTRKLTKAEKNAIIGKKCANVGSYKTSAQRQQSASESSSQSLQHLDKNQTSQISNGNLRLQAKN